MCEVLAIIVSIHTIFRKINIEQDTESLLSMTKAKPEVSDFTASLERLYVCNQKVRFVGGEGTVKKSTFKGGTWQYLIEMPQGKEPTFGRVGAETMVLLNEKELCAA